MEMNNGMDGKIGSQASSEQVVASPYVGSLAGRECAKCGKPAVLILQAKARAAQEAMTGDPTSHLPYCTLECQVALEKQFDAYFGGAHGGEWGLCHGQGYIDAGGYDDYQTAPDPCPRGCGGDLSDYGLRYD